MLLATAALDAGLSAHFVQQPTEAGDVVTWSRRVVVVPGAAPSADAAHADDALFWALFAAYVEYFVALAGTPSAKTLREARRRDARARAWGATKWGAVAALVLGCAFAAAATAPRSASPHTPLSDSARERKQTAPGAQAELRTQALSRRINDAAARALEPVAAIEAVGQPPFVQGDGLLAGVHLVADPGVAGAQAPSPNALLTLLWLRPEAVAPLRFIGLSWDGAGVVRRVDLSEENSLKPVASPLPVGP